MADKKSTPASLLPPRYNSPPSRFHSYILATLLAGVLISAPVAGLHPRCEVGLDGAGNPIYKSGRKTTGKPFKKQRGRRDGEHFKGQERDFKPRVGERIGWEAIADFFKVSEGKMRGKKKKLLEAGVIFYIRWGRPLSMPLFGFQGAKLCFPLSLFWLSFPPP